MFYRVEFSDKG